MSETRTDQNTIEFDRMPKLEKPFDFLPDSVKI